VRVESGKSAIDEINDAGFVRARSIGGGNYLGCDCAAAMSANAAIPTQCDSQSRRVDCMIYLARSGGRLANPSVVP
jgi:hypothetical protein